MRLSRKSSQAGPADPGASPPEAETAGEIVRLDATGIDVEDPAALAAQIPAAASLAPGTTVRVEATAVERRTGLRAWLGDGRAHVSRAARCTALLARGYTAIAAEGDLVRGQAPAAADPDS